MTRTRMLSRRIAVLLVGGMIAFSTSAFAAATELSLDDSVALALKNNPAIKLAQADRDAAQWKINEAASNGKAKLSLTHTDTHAKTAPSVLSKSSIRDNFDSKISLNVPIYTGGGVEAVTDQAKLNLQANDLSVLKTKQQVKLDATTAYYGVLQARNMLSVAQESVDALKEHLKNVQAQFKAGTVAKSDVLRSEVELANAEQALIKAQNAYDLAIANLNNVAGLPLDTTITLKDELKYTAYSKSLEDCITVALKSRPEAAQVDIGVEAAKAGVKAAKSGNLPTVGLGAYSDWSDSDFPGLSNNNWGISLQASWNVFDSGLTKSKIAQANAGVDKAGFQVKQTKDGIQLDVRSAYLNMREAEKRIDTSKVAVARAQEDFKIAQVRYTSGVGTNIDVIDAQVALSQAKTNYVQALYDYNTSKAKLDKAMGVSI